MEYIAKVSRHYLRRGHLFIQVYNHPAILPYYFGYMIPYRARRIWIADLGVGICSSLGGIWNKTQVIIKASDILWDEYAKIWASLGVQPIIPIETQDMQHLTYADDSFHVVHCVNALDHVVDARAALQEMWRVCKPDGWIYLRHYPNQHSHLRGKHRWDARPDGFYSGKDHILLDGFTTHMDGHFIISTYHKDGRAWQI